MHFDNINDDLFTRAMKQHPVLPQEEVRKLIAVAQKNFYPYMARIQAGEPLDPKEKCLFQKGKWSNDRIIMHNLGLIRSRAEHFYKGFQGKFNNDRSLVQQFSHEGVIGLMAGIEKFDLKRNVQFSTYSTYWIDQAIRRWIQNNKTIIRLPIHIQDSCRKINKICAEVWKETGRKPTAQEIADRLGVTQQFISSTLEGVSKGKMLSLNYKIEGSKGNTEFADLFLFSQDVTPQEHAELTEEKERIAAMLSNLDEEQRQAITLRFGLDDGISRSAKEVGQLLGKNKDAIRVIYRKAFNGLKEQVKDLPSFDAEKHSQVVKPRPIREIRVAIRRYVAHHPGCSFKEILDGADLPYAEAWEAVMRLKRSGELVEKPGSCGRSCFTLEKRENTKVEDKNRDFVHQRLLSFLASNTTALKKEIEKALPDISERRIRNALATLRGRNEICASVVYLPAVRGTSKNYVYYLPGTQIDLNAVAEQKLDILADIQKLPIAQQILQRVLSFHPKSRAEILEEAIELGITLTKQHLGKCLRKFESEGLIIRRDLPERGTPAAYRLPLELKPGLFVVENQHKPSQRFGWVESVNPNQSVVCRWVDGSCSISSDVLLDLVSIGDAINYRRIETAKLRHEGKVADISTRQQA